MGFRLPDLMGAIAADTESRLSQARALIPHPGEKGDASERVWRGLLGTYLPLRYMVETAFVIDSRGQSSDQIDIVIFDRQYSPLIFEFEGKKVIPAESVYAIFEVKQQLDQATLGYAVEKAASVRRLFRTNLPVTHLDGSKIRKPIPAIVAGILTLETTWSPPFGEPFLRGMREAGDDGRLDLGCVAAKGKFHTDPNDGSVIAEPRPGSTTRFLFQLISCLQQLGTVPRIDMEAYSEHLPIN